MCSARDVALLRRWTLADIGAGNGHTARALMRLPLRRLVRVTRQRGGVRSHSQMSRTHTDCDGARAGSGAAGSRIAPTRQCA